MMLVSVYLFTYLFVTVKTPDIYFVFSLKEARNNFRDRSKSKKTKVMSESEDDLEWQPPTEAEKKVLAARRERSDKVPWIYALVP